MKRYAVEVHLKEFECSKAGELMGDGESINQNIVFVSNDEADAKDVYEEVEGIAQDIGEEYE